MMGQDDAPRGAIWQCVITYIVKFVGSRNVVTTHLTSSFRKENHMNEAQARKAEDVLSRIYNQRSDVEKIKTLMKRCTHDETVLQLTYGMDGDGFTLAHGCGKKQVQALLDKEQAKLDKLIKELEDL